MSERNLITIKNPNPYREDKTMETARSALRETVLFALGTFAPTVALAWWAHQQGSPGAAAMITPLAMLTPALSAFAVQKMFVKRPILRGQPFNLTLGRWKWLFFAPVAFALAIAASVMVSFVLTPGLLADKTTVASSISHLRGLPATGLGAAGQFALALTMSLCVGPLLNIPLFLGEELGWRAFMNPRLVQVFGQRGLLLGGAIWAVWHLPMILLGWNYFQHPWMGMLIWIPLCMSMNVLLDAIKRRSDSIFPCALAHGAMDQVAPLLMSVLFVRTQFTDLVDGPAGLAGLIVFGGPAIIVYLRARFTCPRSDRDATGSTAVAA